jgi:hypothetical protein
MGRSSRLYSSLIRSDVIRLRRHSLTSLLSISERGSLPQSRTIPVGRNERMTPEPLRPLGSAYGW